MQISLFPMKSKLVFGGELLKGKRKSKRPLSSKVPLHIVLRANQSTLYRNRKSVQNFWDKFARQFGIVTYELAICSNHVHAVARIQSQRQYNRFIQSFSGAVAKTLKLKWVLRPFTRLVTWGKDFKKVCAYVILNMKEAEGVVAYRPRGRFSSS